LFVDTWLRFAASRRAVFGTAVLLAALVAASDFLIRTDISVGILYIAPISLAAWHAGFAGGLLLGAFCGLAWLANDTWFAAHPASPAAVLTNFTLRLEGFAFLAFVLSRYRLALDREKSISKFKSEMLSLVTHEFNNSLAVGSLAVAVLREGDPDPAPRRSELYDTLDRQNKLLKQAVTNFLGVARTESEGMVFSFAPASPDALIRDTISVLTPLMNQKQLRLEREPGAAPNVRADADALTLVLTNLLGNAVKFTPTGGHIAVKAVAVPEGGAVRFVVEDAGIGMTKEELERFESDLPVSDAVKRPGGGFGLGLRLARSLLRGHGAELRVTSSRGFGTRFTFELPVWK
jgi:signal transduction histidine kinase